MLTLWVQGKPPRRFPLHVRPLDATMSQSRTLIMVTTLLRSDILE